MIRDGEYNRRALNVAELSLEVKDSWKEFATIPETEIHARDSARQTVMLWEERLSDALELLWQYREQKRAELGMTC